jgi:hypothetical protein
MDIGQRAFLGKGRDVPSCRSSITFRSTLTEFPLSRVRFYHLMGLDGILEQSCCGDCSKVLTKFAPLGLVPIRFAVPRTLLAGAFASQCSFSSLLLAGLQIERVPLDVLGDVFRHDFSLKAFERTLQTLAFVKLNFRQRTHLGFQSVSTPQRNSFPLGQSPRVIGVVSQWPGGVGGDAVVELRPGNGIQQLQEQAMVIMKRLADAKSAQPCRIPQGWVG